MSSKQPQTSDQIPPNAVDSPTTIFQEGEGGQIISLNKDQKTSASDFEKKLNQKEQEKISSIISQSLENKRKDGATSTDVNAAAVETLKKLQTEDPELFKKMIEIQMANQ